MSKDRGTKNIKKAPADKSKGKVLSAYKSEGKFGVEKQPVKGTTPKPDAKKDNS